MIKNGNVVMKYLNEGSEINFCDDYCCNLTKEKIDFILKRIEKIAVKRLK